VIPPSPTFTHRFPLSHNKGNPLFWKYQKSLPFNPDSEWDDGFTTEDCQDDHFSRFLSNVFYGMNMAMCLAFIYTDGVVLRELVRAKALKWNATAYSLVAMFIYATSMFFISMIYFLNNWDRDVIEFWYNSRALLFVYLKAPFEVIVDFEICLTWIDLYDRTQKMSKNSSRALNVLRWSMRLIAVGVAIASYYMTRFGGIVGLLTTNMFSPILGGIFTLIGGNLIIKVLCPNNKDVANPNWIIASSIRRAVNNGIICSFFLIFGLGGMTLTVRHPLYGHSYGWFCTCYFCMTVVRIWNWLQYIICGSRKHLKKFSTEQSSSYFGFSTIGLNKTLTNVSSRLSSAAKSSVLSSKSSAAFTGKSEAA